MKREDEHTVRRLVYHFDNLYGFKLQFNVSNGAWRTEDTRDDPTFPFLISQLDSPTSRSPVSTLARRPRASAGSGDVPLMNIPKEVYLLSGFACNVGDSTLEVRQAMSYLQLMAVGVMQNGELTYSIESAVFPKSSILILSDDFKHL